MRRYWSALMVLGNPFQREACMQHIFALVGVSFASPVASFIFPCIFLFYPWMGSVEPLLVGLVIAAFCPTSLM